MSDLETVWTDDFKDYWVNLIIAVELATGDSSGLPIFMTARGRLPRIGDDRAPWSFRGWMLPYVMDLWPMPIYGEPDKSGERQVVRKAPGRWGYWLYIRTRGELPPNPIPPWLDFGAVSSMSGAALRNLEKCTSLLGRSVGFSAAVNVLIQWLGWALAVVDKPPSLSDEDQEALYRTFSIDHWLREPADYLGRLMSESKGRGHDPTAFFPTPWSLVDMMTRFTWGEVPTAETVLMKFHEPCIGTGRFALAASNYSIKIYGQDVNPVCVTATKINGAVFAPWLAFSLRLLSELEEPEALPELEPEVSPEPVVSREPAPKAEMSAAAPRFDKSGQGLLFG